MKKRIFALFTAAMMLLSFATVNAEDAALHPDEQQVIEYSNNMLKAMVRTYAHDIADNYYYGIADEELLFAVICSAIDEGKLNINKAVEAMIAALEDEHAEFYEPQEYVAMTEDIVGEFSGIGVVISQTEKGILVSSVLDNSPALKAGIMEGDYITAVNGAQTGSLSVNEVRNLIVGATDTQVVVKVLRSEQEIELTCTRDTVQVSNIETRMLEDDMAYLRILQFSKNTPEEVEKYVKEIQGNYVKKLVLDLRNNPGGDLDAAIDIANIFISAGNIAQLRYKDETKNTYVKSTNYNAPRLKIAVLVNENSASASEFLSMAFQSRGAGKIIGAQTYGKGSMQNLRGLATGAGMKYTIGEFYSTKGKRVHTVGITPDIAVENEHIPVDEDSFVKIDYDRMDEAGKDGEMTLALEQRLEALGYLGEEADEVFDENTTQAVKNLQILLGYDMTGVPGFYEYLYVNDYTYDFDIVVDKQLEEAVNYLNK